METRFKQFCREKDNLHVYLGDSLIFHSAEAGLKPLLDYLASHAAAPVTIFDRIVGNAAALLAITAGCREIYSPKASEAAVTTLGEFHIVCHFGETIPYVQKPDGSGMCPMERLSLGKTPAEFYRLLKKQA